MEHQDVSFARLAGPGVQGLRPYQPGKPESELAREFGLDENSIVKLASNENPLGPGPAVVEAVRQTLANAGRYPDGGGFELRRLLAEKHAVDPAAITLGNGSNDVLELLARAFLGPAWEAIFSAHAFAVYYLATQAVGARQRIAPALAADHAMAYGHDPVAFQELLSDRTRMILIANPNNPTGTWLTGDQLEELLELVAGDVLVVVDEAYVEYAEVEAGAAGYVSVMPWLERYRNLVVTRTFSKAYGLAGLRVGYCVSHPEIAEVLNRVRQPFNVSTPALVGAAAALADTDHLRAAVELNRRGLVQLRQGLQDLGLACLPSAANFLCVELDRPGRELFQALLPQGVIVRPVDNYGLTNFLRVSVGTEAENACFLQAFAGAFASEGAGRSR